jgi:hypothetical protein
MKDWLSFHDYYLADIPGCTYFAAANQIRMAAQEFCKRSKAWRATLDPVKTVAKDNYIYDFDRTREIEVVKLLSATLDGHPLDPLLPDQDDGRQRGILALNGREFVLFPTPAAGLNVVAKAILAPSNTATGIDDKLYAEYAEAIAFGAKYRLFNTENKPYSNPQAAANNFDLFETAIGRATIRAAKAYSSAPLRTSASFL